jgi:hypothetical protein
VERNATNPAPLKSKHTTRPLDVWKQVLLECCDVEGIEIPGAISDANVIWNGRVVDNLHPLTSSEKEEILWELSELNFRFEFLALDALLRPARDYKSQFLAKQQEIVSRCFSGSNGSILVVDLAHANSGPADLSWVRRAPHLHAMWGLMKKWNLKGGIPMVAEKSEWLESDIVELERVIAKLYTQAFFDNFNRAPIVPRRLSH